MKMLKKIITTKIAIVVILVVVFIAILIGVISGVCGVAMGYEETVRQASKVKGANTVVNNQIYADRYRKILDKYLIEKGYVSLERLVFYLQRKNNILDITTLSNDEWEQAYLENLNEKEKQMIPIKTICKNFNDDSSIPNYTVGNGLNDNGVYIEALNLCVVDGVDITTSNDYSEDYKYLPFVFPLKRSFSVTSMLFEIRDVDLGLTGEQKEQVNFHSGWDFSVPIGTDFYSICNGTLLKVVNTQFNDLPFKQSGNSTGNYISVQCDNGLKVTYHHIKANSLSLGIREGFPVREGELLGKTSTTGLSTGPHLHLGLQNSEGSNIDALEYIDFNYKKG